MKKIRGNAMSFSIKPVIKFIFDKKLDQDIAWEFYNNPKHGGSNFWQERAVANHPKLKEMDLSKNPKEYLNKFISQYYRANAKEIKFLGNEIHKNFKEKETMYFLLVSRIFNNYPWPKKKFTGVFSIFDFCPRFLDWGGFQIFLYDNRSMQLFTIFHEMLHFIFYDFAQQKFPEIFKKMETEQGKFWDLAEVFNAVIQDTNNFVKLHGKIKNLGYPNHKNLIIKGRNLWKKNQDLRQWIVEMMKIL